MSKKVLILGSKGMAGHVLFHYFKENTDFAVIDIARNNDFFNSSFNFDLADFGSLSNIISTERPSVVINCAGILNKDAEDNPDQAILINSYLPHYLAKLGEKEKFFKLIHISTDCVFNGKKGGYTINDFKDGIGFYAQSKALGEITYGNNLTLRTSIIGPELRENGIGLFQWFTKQHGEIMGYSNAYWTGVTTIELAKAIVAAINQNITGLHHLVYEEKISKYDLIELFRSVFNREDIQVAKYDNYHIDKSLIKNKSNFEFEVPSYETMIGEMKDWIQKHKSLYNY